MSQADLFKREVESGNATPRKAKDFDNWRQKQSGEERAAADAAWALWEARLKQGAPQRPVAVRAVAAVPARPGAKAGPPPSKASNAASAPASVLGEGSAFHNPYTFLPFPPKPLLRRGRPTPLTVDEVERERESGVLELEVRTLSPLLSCDPSPEGDGGHKTYRVLAAGPDAIVPATGVRGALRALMAMLYGGRLSYVDDGLWLCQGRDAQLGPAGKTSPPSTPAEVFLAEVLVPGSANKDGRVRLGKTRLVKWETLEQAAARDKVSLQRPVGAKVPVIWSSESGDSLSTTADDDHPWLLKLSGRPVNPKGKREGLFLPEGGELVLPASLWAAYAGRNRHGERPELHKGDLVWLQPASPGLRAIARKEEVKSIQWARWGREGSRLLDLVRSRHGHHLPDSFATDGLVDEITDLFGQVPRDDLAGRTTSGAGAGAAPAFAARVRPENLVFRDGAGRTERVTLAPLAPPHPGCVAFYRAGEPDTVGVQDGLRGYKVYRNTAERGAGAPWRYENQAVYDERGVALAPRQKVNKTCDLLAEGLVGTLRIAFRALSRRELALLLGACGVDWRLGGGKPLGLGHCRVTALRWIDEDGAERMRLAAADGGGIAVPAPYGEELTAFRERIALYRASQVPVPFLRYPRAVAENLNRKQRGGHVWFQRHAGARKAGEGGLQVLWTRGELQAAAGGRESIKAQVLPPFDPAHPLADRLHGYDLFPLPAECVQERNRVTRVGKMEAFDPARHGRAGDHGGQNRGWNREAREDIRAERGRLVLKVGQEYRGFPPPRGRPAGTYWRKIGQDHFRLEPGDPPESEARWNR